MTILHMLELKQQLDENGKKLKQLAAIAGGLILLCTVWIWDLEDQKEALMFKLSKMRIEVAKCEGER